MEDAGLTQEALAEILNCSKGQVSMLLSGERKYHAKWISLISEKLRIPEWYLFVDPKMIPDDKDQELISRYNALPENGKDNVWRTIELEEFKLINPAEDRQSMTLHEKNQPGYEHKED